VRTRSGDLERTPSPLLTTNVRKVGNPLNLIVSRDVCWRRRRTLAPEVSNSLCEVSDRDRLDPGERDLRTRFLRADETPGAVPPCTLRCDESPRHRTKAPVERELTYGSVTLEAAEWKLTRCREHGQRDRKIETGALLLQISRREIDRDPAQRPLELGRRDPAPDALFRFLTGAIGQANDCESRHPALQMSLHLDPPDRGLQGHV
jgi:hypothetical protein